jgi:hypothetical protein
MVFPRLAGPPLPGGMTGLQTHGGRRNAILIIITEPARQEKRLFEKDESA